MVSTARHSRANSGQWCLEVRLHFRLAVTMYTMLSASDITTTLVWRLPTTSTSANNMLKLLALGLMLSDHIHFVFFNRQLEWLYWLSRLVFPIFALIAAQNVELHRANPKRYISRLLIYGVIAQPFYWLAFGFTQLNVMFTLAVSIATWWWLEVARARGLKPGLRFAPIVLLAIGAIFLEFWWAGVLAVPIYAAVMRRGAWWDWLAALAVAFGIVGFTSLWIMPLVALGLWTLASRLPTRSSPKPSRWIQHAAYAFYPLHLAVIAGVKLILQT
jgi:TraX protein